MSKPKPAVPLVKVSLHLPATIWEAIRAEAKREGISLSKAVGLAWINRR